MSEYLRTSNERYVKRQVSVIRARSVISLSTEYRHEAAVLSREQGMKWMVLLGDGYQWPLPRECSFACTIYVVWSAALTLEQYSRGPARWLQRPEVAPKSTYQSFHHSFFAYKWFFKKNIHICLGNLANSAEKIWELSLLFKKSFRNFFSSKFNVKVVY